MLQEHAIHSIASSHPMRGGLGVRLACYHEERPLMISLTQNIELQVQLENIKKELAEKDSLLMQAKYVFL